MYTSMMKIWQDTHQAFDLWGWDKRRGVYTCMELEYYEFFSFLFFIMYLFACIRSELKQTGSLLQCMGSWLLHLRV